MNLPPEALPATVLELDETEMTTNKQRKLKVDKFDKERNEARKDAALKTKKKSKESMSSPLAKSEDLVDEELANMDQAESLSIDVLSSNVCNLNTYSKMNQFYYIGSDRFTAYILATIKRQQINFFSGCNKTSQPRALQQLKTFLCGR